jgi:alkylation response protein AidB-like acyl-CoA dehydrogenase
MDFQFSAEQDARRDAVRAFMTDWVARADARAGLAPTDWQAMVDLGWTGILVPEASGGLGLGLVDAVVVLEEMGRVAFPGPYLSVLVASDASRRLGLDDRLAAIASGSVGTVALEESGHDDPVTRVRTRARRSGARWTVTGEKPIVVDGPGADWVLIVARTADGLGTFLVEDPAIAPVPTIDATRRIGRLDLADLPAVPVGPPGDHTAIWRAVADDTAVALAAELTGVCDGALAMAMDYAEHRVQFDQPIASHQVIQH